jgi:hypothetical protein
VIAQQAVLGEELVVPLMATDPEGSPLTFTLNDTTLPGAEILDIDGVPSFRWTPDAMDVTPGLYPVNITVADDADPAGLDMVEFDVTVLARPFLDLDNANPTTGFTGSWIFGGSDVPILFPARVTITDLDSPTMANATVSIETPFDGTDEVLTANDLGTSITVTYDPDINILTLTGTDTVENYRLVLATLHYGNRADAPTFGSRTIHLTVNDGTLESNIATSTIIVESIPDGSDTIATADALDISLGQTAEESRLIETGADVDIFAVEAVAGETLFVSITEATVGTYLRLFDGSAVEVASHASHLTFDVTVGGTYYIGVSAADFTDYDPNVSVGRTATDIGAYDLVVSRFTTGMDNDTIPLATSISVTTDSPTTVMDGIVSASDVDLFAVDVNAGQQLTVEVTASDDDVIIRIFDEFGNDIGMDDGTPNLLTTQPAADGVVYIGISSEAMGSYQPNNPDGRTGGTPTDYAMEITLMNVDMSPSAIDEVMSELNPAAHDTYLPW